MPTAQQVKLIQIARRQVGLDEPAYRMLLHNVAGVDSCKLLDNPGVEDVMAVMEDMGFRMAGEPAFYWRGKVSARGSICGERMAMKINALCAYTKFEAAGMAERMSKGRTRIVEQLGPREAYNVIEALKKMINRQDAEGAKEIT